MKAHMYDSALLGWDGEDLYCFFCVPEVGLHVRVQLGGGKCAIIGSHGEPQWRVIGKCDSISCQAIELDTRVSAMILMAKLPKRHRNGRRNRGLGTP